MKSINDLFYVGLAVGRPAGLGYMAYGVIAREPLAFLEGLTTTLACDFMYRKNKVTIKNSNHKLSLTDQS